MACGQCFIGRLVLLHGINERVQVLNTVLKKGSDCLRLRSEKMVSNGRQVSSQSVLLVVNEGAGTEAGCGGPSELLLTQEKVLV